jgi:Tol biopolymer transport system component
MHAADRALVLLVASAVVLVCAFAGGAMSAPSSLPGANGLVVAETGRGFVLLNATTNSLVAGVPGTGRFDHAPAFSPDGRRIAFSTTRQGDSEIYAIDVNGRRLQELTFRPTADDDPAWSSDGRFIAFESFENGNFDIWIMRAEVATSGA